MTTQTTCSRAANRPPGSLADHHRKGTGPSDKRVFALRAALGLIDGIPAIHRASSTTDVNTLRLLVNTSGSSVLHARDIEGNTPLFWAIRSGQHDVVELYLNHGADPNHRNHSGLTPLLIAASHLDNNDIAVRVFTVLLAHGASPLISTTDGATPLHIVSATGNSPCAGLLVKEGGSPLNVSDAVGDRALHYAVREERSELIDALCALGADVNACNNDRESPLFLAQTLGLDINVVDALKRNGAVNNNTSFASKEHEARTHIATSMKMTEEKMMMMDVSSSSSSSPSVHVMQKHSATWWSSTQTAAGLGYVE